MQIKSAKKFPLLSLLLELSPDSSKTTLRSWIQQGRVTVDGEVAKIPSQMVEEGQEVSVGPRRQFLSHNVELIYEDHDIVVIDKPAFLLSVATEKETQHTAHAVLKRHRMGKPVYPIHRLDRDTSGLLAFAYSDRARKALKKQLEERSVMREYRALVHGHPGKGTWRSFLRENQLMQVHVCAPSKGKEAITHFETVAKKGECSLLRLRLESGRKHQIRVQAAASGFPIVGDRKYGRVEDAGKSLQLRAVALTLTHPTSGKKMHFGSSQGTTGKSGS